MFALPVGGRLRLVTQTTRMLINSSYQIQDYQIIGAPDWMRTEKQTVRLIASRMLDQLDFALDLKPETAAAGLRDAYFRASFFQSPPQQDETAFPGCP